MPLQESTVLCVVAVVALAPRDEGHQLIERLHPVRRESGDEGEALDLFACEADAARADETYHLRSPFSGAWDGASTRKFQTAGRRLYERIPFGPPRDLGAMHVPVRIASPPRGFNSPWGSPMVNCLDRRASSIQR